MPKADTKYSAACNEICARIQARNRTLMGFFSLTAVILGVAIRGEGLAIIGVGISYAALVMVIVSNHHENMIARLMDFQREVAKKDEEDAGIEWTSPDFYGKTAGIRVRRDLAQLALVVLGSIAPLLLVWARWEDYPEQYRPSYLIASIGALICLTSSVCLILKNIVVKWRNRGAGAQVAG